MTTFSYWLTFWYLGIKYMLGEGHAMVLPLALSDDKHSVHASTTVRLAIVSILSRNVKLHFKEFAFLSNLIINHRDCFLVNTARDAVHVKDHVVGATLVVNPSFVW